jgi:hypothetical protein
MQAPIGFRVLMVISIHTPLEGSGGNYLVSAKF